MSAYISHEHFDDEPEDCLDDVNLGTNEEAVFDQFRRAVKLLNRATECAEDLEGLAMHLTLSVDEPMFNMAGYVLEDDVIFAIEYGIHLAMQRYGVNAAYQASSQVIV